MSVKFVTRFALERALELREARIKVLQKECLDIDKRLQKLDEESIHPKVKVSIKKRNK